MSVEMVRRAVTPLPVTVAAVVPPVKEIAIVKVVVPPKPLPACSPDPKRRYNREKCEIILKQVIDKAMKNFEYTVEEARELCSKLSQDIKLKVKTLDFERYRIICNVSIGEKYMQSFSYVMGFLWDNENDDFATYTYDTPSYYVVASVLGIYLE